MSHRFASTSVLAWCSGLIYLSSLAMGLMVVPTQADVTLSACSGCHRLSSYSSCASLRLSSRSYSRSKGSASLCVASTLSAVPQGERNVEALFGDEIQQAASKLRWHGDSLTPDTAYAVALTGLSWETGWGREHLFSLAWGELRKTPGYRPHNKIYAGLVREIQSGFERHDYRKVVSLASESFSLDEIACDPNLKEPVAQSFLELRQPERAFPLFAAPFEPPKQEHRDEHREENKGRGDSQKESGVSVSQDAESVSQVDRRCRQGAYEAAQQAGLRKEAIAFGLSLLFDPGVTPATLNVALLHALEAQGVDMDRLIMGILQAPDHLHGLPNFTYPAADLLAVRATPRQLSFLLHLASLEDVYLHSRALVGLGVIAYRVRRDDPPGWATKALPLLTLREYGVSSAQRKRIMEEVQKAIHSDHYRLRAAACMTIGLMGDDDDVAQLQKLTKDHAYLLTPDNDHAPNHPHRIQFPVRQAAITSLARYGIHADLPAPPDRELTGKELDSARRGGQDVTNDRRNLRRENAEGIIDFGF